ncbi:hypothetical protein C1H46_012488 [Malus baccata]|uniref:Uncharacterized protein n=1 Tax=Malus baccata TaxID=106549 RepID=A0A540MSU7_MALBA|nr:hypothetical protein C1H46_012488 [Malus baccata]
MESINRIHKRKRDKQSTVSDTVVLLLKAKLSYKLVLHPEKVETIVGLEQVANKDETVVAPKLLKVVDDEMIDVQQQEDDDDERTVSDVLDEGNDQISDEEFQMTLFAWITKKQIQDKLKVKMMTRQTNDKIQKQANNP